MPCEHHKDALIEVAANGAIPQAELRAHLDKCASCRAAFNEEQALFIAIDTGLHAGANSEVPPSLLPRVRAGLEKMPISFSRWTHGWFALTGASLVAATLLVALVVSQKRVGIRPVRSTDNRPLVSEAVPPTQNQLRSALSPMRDSNPRASTHATSASARPEHAVTAQSAHEVLVPRDQELLLAGYAQQWSSRRRAPLIVNDGELTAVELLEVVPIQITKLDVKPLAEGDSQ
ncbi:MAG TPA: hypothetical protein VJN89_03350 [Candidatus Acidoferrum sp.]|nr:hypothetical protein [Candidatus Acidoferrum sp.]